MTVMRSKHLALMLILILVAGCAGVKPAPRVIVDDTQTIVRLDVDQNIKGPDDPNRYTHPAEIKAAQLQTIFEAIRVQAQRLGLQKKFSGDSTQQQVFRPDEIARLAPILKDAFAQAAPHERIVFALSQPAETGMATTAGELFIKGHQLHFILSCFQLRTTDTNLISRCQDNVAPQGFELHFTQPEYFVSFGTRSFLLGNSTKEIIIDFSKISVDATPES